MRRHEHVTLPLIITLLPILKRVTDVNIIFDLSPWLILPVILTGIGYAVLLYVGLKKMVFNSKLSRFLAVIRFLLVSLIAILLLHPYLMRQKKLIEQPVIILAHDNSASIIMGADSSKNKLLYSNRFDSLYSLLKESYQVDPYTFGQKLKPDTFLDFREQQTDISELFKEIHTAYFNRNVGAVVLLTDGISNKGVPVDLMEEAQPIPVYAVGMGDTVVRPDVSISDMRHNRIIFKDSRFPVELSIKAQKAAGQQLKVQLTLNGENVASTDIQIVNDLFTWSQTFQISANESGRKKLVASVSEIADEQIIENNYRESYIDILDEKAEILILARAPHPDIAAIRSVFGEQYKTKVEYIHSWKPKGNSYGLIILHDLPATNYNNLMLESFFQENQSCPLWVIIGTNTDLAALNHLQDNIQFRAETKGTVDLFPVTDNAFSLFSVDAFQRERLNRFPALSAPMLEANLPLNHSTFIYQRIRGIPTNYPLLGYTWNNNRRMAYLVGNGLWRWRIADYNQNGNHHVFNELISKTVSYLLVKADNRRLRLFADASFLINDEILFRAELYNPALELVNEPDILLYITNTETETTYDYLFTRVENTYRLNAGRLPAGSYTFKAETVLGNERLSFDGDFIVSSTSIEAANLVADHEMLQRLTKQTKGQFLPYNRLMAIPQLLKEDARITSTSSVVRNYEPFISLKWFATLLFLLAAIEWLVRKANGGY